MNPDQKSRVFDRMIRRYIWQRRIEYAAYFGAGLLWGLYLGLVL